MYWKAVNLKYEGENHIKVGILLFETTKEDEKPVLYILGAIKGSGVKGKWRRPLKIKRWLLYDHNHPYATRFLKSTIFNDNFKVTEFGKREMLYGFDKDIIAKKFPTMAKEVFWVIKNKKKK